MTTAQTTTRFPSNAKGEIAKKDSLSSEFWNINTYEEYKAIFDKTFNSLLTFHPKFVGSANASKGMGFLEDEFPEWFERANKEFKVF